MNCVAWRGVETVPGLEDALGSLVTRHRWAELEGFVIRNVFMPEQDLEQVRRIRAASLLIVGDQELEAFVQCADTLAGLLPDNRRLQLRDTHHLCLLQSPDQAAGPIGRLLAEHAAQLPQIIGESA